MADTGLSLLDDTPQATPLDLLINAISGSGQYHFSTADDGAVAGPSGEEGGSAAPDAIAAYLNNNGDATSHAVAEAAAAVANGGSTSRKRSADDEVGSPRLRKIARTLGEHFNSRQSAHGHGPSLSTVELWHPKTGQKSYGKERRILQPPPTLRITGPLAPLLTDVTLSSLANPDPAAGAVVFSSQTHRIGSPVDYSKEMIPDEVIRYDLLQREKARRSAKKRRLREAAAKTGWGSTLPWERNKTAPREHDELAEGLTFPGLWVGEDHGKSKEFRLELSLGQPRAKEMADESPSTIEEAALQRALQEAAVESVMFEEQERSAQAALLVEGIEDYLPPRGPEPVEPVTHGPLEKPWARFDSDPLTIVSKPSQRTAKARSMVNCLSSTDAFSLVVRVNAQTVRTKFMKLDMVNNTPSLGARTGKWSPFRFEVIQRASPPEAEDKSQRTRLKLDAEGEKGVVTYGSIVQLVDVINGSRSDSFRLVRVDKNEVVIGADHGHPVSELQRVGLVRVIDGQDDMEGGGRWYLSAPGAVAGAGEVKTTRARPTKSKEPVAPPPETIAVVDELALPPPPATLNSLDLEATQVETATAVETSQEPSTPTRTRKKKTARHALARAAITEEEQGSTASGLVWHRAQRREGEYTVTEGKVATTRQATIETVDDWMCWVLSGVWCFSYSFFNGLGDEDPIPKVPLDLVPRLLINPSLHLRENTVDLTLSAFFTPDSQTGEPQPFSVYLGPIGPLRATTWRSAAPKEKYYDPNALYPAYPYSGIVEENIAVPEEPHRVFSNFPFSVPHVIANLELPAMAEILRAMEEYSQPEPEVQQPPAEPEPTEDPEWFGVMGPATELTIQQAIQNAGEPHQADHDVASILQVPVEVNRDDFGMKEGFEMSTLIDPAMDAPPPPPPVPQPEEAPVPLAPAPLAPVPLAETETETAPTVTMYRPEQPKEAFAPLPLLLVRPDGVGHGIGWSILAHQKEATDTEPAGWGLQIVQTSARGQRLGW